MMMLSGLFCFKKTDHIFANLINEIIVTLY
jgi:hypothetical protein